MSDAVDRTIAEINFGPLAGRTVFFDATYIRSVKALGFVNSDYVISALRQQMVSSGCLLEDDRESADFIVEGRVGALGTDGHEIVYGVPASTGVSDAASLLPNTPSIPMIPEISVAKKQDYLGATKIALFAYHRESRERVWQSGVAVQTSNAKDISVLRGWALYRRHDLQGASLRRHAAATALRQAFGRGRRECWNPTTRRKPIPAAT